MSALWFETALADSPAEACWELYHENSKRGRRFRPEAAPGGAPGRPTYDGFPEFPLADLPAAETSRSLPAAGGVAPLSLKSLSGLMAEGCRPLGEADPIEALVLVNAVESLPDGLFHYDPGRSALRRFRHGDIAGKIAEAFASPETVRRARAVLFLVGNLAEAARRDGERGYRDALIFAGRHLAALGVAAAVAGCRVEDVGAFYDREVDALLALDGLERSVLAILAVVA